jgi:hypothetical protein
MVSGVIMKKKSGSRPITFAGEEFMEYYTAK